ncbi:MAG: P1 family peptidase [Gemmatimonadota bacterium]|nr:MAG: P1 family peptidase [Gemmatimonadota bacterium]
MSPRITAIPGISLGHTTDREAGTGCTVVLAPPEGMRAAALVRGRATGTRELDALSPRHLVPTIHAILLTGGSAYGLGAADGVMRWLSERGRGFDVGVGVVPIVPAAVVFDLTFAAARWPTADDAYRACERAGQEVEEGSVGVGTGATVGKALGRESAMKSGCGTWAEQRDGLIVGSFVVVNAFGDVRDRDNNIIAGARASDGFLDARRYLADGGPPGGAFAKAGTNTTLVVVATNANLDCTGLESLAAMTADSLAQRITPVGTQYDGDVVFAVSVGAEVPATAISVELLAQEATGTAIERAVRYAVGTHEVPGLGEATSSSAAGS